jgi:DNA polymerase-3 subunit delta
VISVLCGANSYAVSEALAKIKKDFITKHGNAGVESYSGEQVEASSVAALLGGATLFASDRLVIIKNVSANKPTAEVLVDFLEKIPESTQLVLVETQIDKRTVFYKTLQKKAEVRELNQPDEYELAKWAVAYAKEQGGSLDSQTANFLVQQVGVNQMSLKNELDKLIAYDPTIGKEAILELVEKKPEDTVFQLLDSALGGHSQQAVALLGRLEAAHEDPFQIVNMLIWQTHILAVVGSTQAPEAEVAKAAKFSPFVVKKTRTLARSTASAKLTGILESVAKLDVKLKSTAIDPWRALEQTIMSFGLLD